MSDVIDISVDGVFGYIKAVAEMKNGVYKGESTESWLLKHGRTWTPAPLPADVARGNMGQCFMNAAKLALVRHDLTYVEGIAFSLIPCLHAWCVDRRGFVVDPTWKDPEKCQYFGAPFKRKFLGMFLYKSKQFGLLDCYWLRFPIQNGKYKESTWKERFDDLE